MTRFVPYQERHGKAAKAMRKGSMMTSLLCGNLLAGREPFAGFGQFAGETKE